MIILLTILIILYALTSCKEKIQEKKGNEDNWKVYQQLEKKKNRISKIHLLEKKRNVF